MCVSECVSVGGCECVWGWVCVSVCVCEYECVYVASGVSPANLPFQPTSLLRCPPLLGFIGGRSAEGSQMTKVNIETTVSPMREALFLGPFAKDQACL